MEALPATKEVSARGENASGADEAERVISQIEMESPCSPRGYRQTLAPIQEVRKKKHEPGHGLIEDLSGRQQQCTT